MRKLTRHDGHIAGTLAILIGCLAGAQYVHNQPPSAPSCNEPSWHAQDAAKEAVLSTLLAPSTATIGGGLRFAQYKDADCKFDVFGTVDSQNVYGAMLRKS